MTVSRLDKETSIPKGILSYQTSLYDANGMCRWIGSRFHDWIDYHGVAFSIELLEWGRILRVRQFFIFTVSKHTRMFVL